MRARDSSKEQAIRSKALKMIVNKGFDGFSMQKLAREAGVSPGTLYIYFKSKEDLIFSLAEEEMNRMWDASLTDFDPAMSFSEGLRIQWINRARYSIKHQDRVYFLEQIKHSPQMEKSLKPLNSRFSAVMREFVMNAILREEIIKVPVEVFWSIAYAPLYNLVRFHKVGTSVGGQKFTFSDEVMMQTLELVLKALKPETKKKKK